MFIKRKTIYTLTSVTLLLSTLSAYGQNTSPIMQSQINQPNGVAGLDAAGNVTAPVKTDKTISTTTNLDIGYSSSKRPRATFFRNYGDIASSPNTIHFGGLENQSDAYLNIIGLEMGSSDASGAILSVQDADSSFYSNRNGAGMTDGVVEFTKTNNNPPRLKAGAEIDNIDTLIGSNGKPVYDKDTSKVCQKNVKRTVTITARGFSVSPAFTEEQMQKIRNSGRIRVFTNWKSDNNLSQDTQKRLENPDLYPNLHGMDKPNVYFGYIDASQAWTTGVKTPTVIDSSPNEKGKTTDPDSTTSFTIYANPVVDKVDDKYIGWRTVSNAGIITKDSSDKQKVVTSSGIDENMVKTAPGQNSRIVGRTKNGATCDYLTNTTTCVKTTITDTIDNTKSNETNPRKKGMVWAYSTPSVFIGMADKRFLHNDMAQFVTNAGRADSISTEMTGVEYDLQANQDHDYQ